ncbi:CGNR zinc finger domain-containing protein [Specibacter cremeus]|uniref:CGNR zinc finger domain-containing protein n=1 Tax=Specibacter cremeus TaxID=1629051 RepID=UPI001F0BD01E|nr:CGNR zinc finger domain-containing protein [Specibacter cremeus]
MATSAAELLAGEDKARLKECGRQSCTRVFIDRSRGGNRIWRGMEACGNRVKAANYRSRRRAQERSSSSAAA